MLQSPAERGDALRLDDPLSFPLEEEAESELQRRRKRRCQLVMGAWLFVLVVAVLLLIVLLALKLRHNSCADNTMPVALRVLSTHDALLAGMYDGNFTVADLKDATLGFGVLSALNGELIVADGTAYRVAVSHGIVSVRPIEQSARISYAVYIRGSPVFTKQALPSGLKFNASAANDDASNTLTAFVESSLASPNLPYFFLYTGTFSDVVFAVDELQQRPFAPYLECVAPRQSFMLLNEVRGTLVGFRSPPYMKSIGGDGHQMRFLSEDLSVGGHVLSLSIGDAAMAFTSLSHVDIAFPPSDSFNALSLPYRASETVCN